MIGVNAALKTSEQIDVSFFPIFSVCPLIDDKIVDKTWSKFCGTINAATKLRGKGNRRGYE